jgi:hypothetical protein
MTFVLFGAEIGTGAEVSTKTLEVDGEVDVVDASPVDTDPAVVEAELLAGIDEGRTVASQRGVTNN